ncbi:rhodanese superfamily protein : Pseudouridine synthase, RluA family OS=Pedosphaera parvula (strain Ellin514) GN=Cflav_PD3454 PE=3 SV=1: Rhodanese: PseudoU_synth_2 [Gemmataceae bacterium]|nr:rhodanese superfamily protein : Pseudouridine synthase, RluA family OS=Pedosphaera parvula (strain Ellin514) GN=Cflav_PD3454 PE=3 SV=1: Rhodanese: PseudoU_synth_2 [Gemmataceae bacterium]VTT96842.1 rhodanese superfamily protein : Pseudouridine synthase, RluA family OS=Pedosphaera parvula (strain Ellin514) GN=Cflav_PD3454 PE=3 SV=1: Rhodanese: PseudoU_synth_2 [Gemmataceae bacterium]
MPAVVNAAAYQFAALDNLKALRERLVAACREWGLKGTVLVSTEGVNLFVAGGAAEVDRLLALLRGVPGLEGLTAKVSESREQPFSRMLVKIKKEIIAFGVPGIDPVGRPAPRITPRELKRWLDEGRPVTLLDTRNDFEVGLGTFRGAVPIGIEHFRDFPAAADRLPVPDPAVPVVTFCTGGIRCEKAAPYLIGRGFANVFQLDGGILKYFEECGGAHFDGECFVFDKRVGLAAGLDESGHGLCFACQSVLTPEEAADPRTVEGVSCPRCFRSPDEERARALALHRTKLLGVTTPLPGSTPRDNYRPVRVAARHAGLTVAEFFCDVFPHIPAEEWLAQIAAGNVVDATHRPASAAHRVAAGETYFTVEREQVEPDVNGAVEILHEDDALIVVNKPAPLPMHPSGRFHRNTLQWFLREAYAPQMPRPAHRLDANTSGVAVFTRTAAIARLVQPQFERGEVRKEYLARVTGHPPENVFRCDAPIAATAGHLGARVIDAAGAAAATEFEVVARYRDGTALLRVTPLTGRTNQIRVHLWHLGFTIVGDPMYRAGGHLGDVQTLGVGESPMNLHARRLTFAHPLDGRPVAYEAPLPAWAEEPAARDRV